jgi:hypothetical protein
VCFNDPDHVSIAIHNYHWRLSPAAGDPQMRFRYTWAKSRLIHRLDGYEKLIPAGRSG